MKTIGITGGTGFVGAHLSAALVKKGHNVVIFTRNTAKKKPSPGISYALWNPEEGTCNINILPEIDTFIHLAGAGVAEKRWSDERKREIVDSRVIGTDFLVKCIREHAPKCKTLIAASATGIYGSDHPGQPPYVETDRPSSDFLAETCKLWEASSEQASGLVRTIILRIGIVLGKEGGAYPQFEKPVHFGIMPVLGGGRQMVSWIAVDDLVGLIVFCLEHPEISGVYNAVAPNPVTQLALIKAIAGNSGCLQIPVPSFALKILLGEMSTEVLKSCTVSAAKTFSTGFKFQFPTVDMAIKAISST